MSKIESVPPVAEPRPLTKWSQDRRLEFIDFRLRWEGRLNRVDLTKHFSISVPQASLDIARYLELASANMAYDKSARVYVASTNFKALYASSNASQYLNELLTTQTGLLGPEASFVGWRPSMDLVPTPGRLLNSDTLAALVAAIREHRAVSVLYQSMAQEELQPRAVSPHALAHDGFRWHVRVYCHLRSQYRDFVIARILEIEPSDVTYVEPTEDKQWANVVKLVLVPNPELSGGHQRVIELDYGMAEGKLVLECRQALLFYALKHLGLDQLTGGSPIAHHIVLENRAEVGPLLASNTG
ncbi:WYL domain-containing protein [Rhodoferax sp. OV413]|uniref:helix-turn-helix transcriptional regulator n=1 Tax=Rhodoferax sp. OV413 TaxID=1855285 RepID=UPI00088B34C9|nr:WYL domain-containing protein [Rhodoferax sp. OV413]SDP93058.1 WYL domain-containing protein [Rhodoferax sp. OV413]